MANKNLLKSGKITSTVLQKLAFYIAPGISSLDLDQLAYKLTKKLGGIPAFLNYKKYPNSLCVSVNNVLVHGIPTVKKLSPGDVVSLDFGVNYRGYYSDAAYTIQIPPKNVKIELLLKNTRQALWRGIKMALANNEISRVSTAIETVAIKYHYGIIHELSGHGIGQQLHTPPSIPNYNNHNRLRLKTGQAVAIEPMFAIKSDSIKEPNRAQIKISKDKWSVLLKYNNIGAHFEHTVLVTNSSPLVITKPIDTNGYIW